jgi:hypothetical protein
MELTVVGVNEATESQFTVDFVGQLDPHLPQGTYRFEDDEDSFEIFIVPRGPDAAGTQMRYDAAFS